MPYIADMGAALWRAVFVTFERDMMMLSNNLNRYVKNTATVCIVLGAAPLALWAVQNSVYVAKQFVHIMHAAAVHVVPYMSQFG